MSTTVLPTNRDARHLDTDADLTPPSSRVLDEFVKAGDQAVRVAAERVPGVDIVEGIAADGPGSVDRAQSPAMHRAVANAQDRSCPGLPGVDADGWR